MRQNDGSSMKCVNISPVESTMTKDKNDDEDDGSCPLCPIMDKACKKLPDGDYCKRLVDAAKRGNISSEEFAKRVYAKYGDRIIEALEEEEKNL